MTMEIEQYLGFAQRWWWLLLIGAIVGAGIGYSATAFETEVYQARTTIMIGTFVQSANPNTGQLATISQLANSYAEIIRREPVLRATVEALGLPMDWSALRSGVQGRLVANTQLFEIRFTHHDPFIAQAVTNELAQQLIIQSPTRIDPNQQAQDEFVQTELTTLQDDILTLRQEISARQDALRLEVDLEGIQREEEEIAFLEARLKTMQQTYALMLDYNQEEPVNELTVIEPATVPNSPVSTSNAFQQLLWGGIIGIALASGLGVVIQYFDTTFKSPEEVEATLHLPVLAVVRHTPALKSTTDHLIVAQNNFSPNAEAFRTLRTNIQFYNTGSMLKTLLVTSSIDGEGKSLTASNLALVMAQTGKEVILIDADLRRPTLDRIFKIPNWVGMSSLLTNESLSLESVLARRKYGNLRVVSSGPIQPNPAELVDSGRMAWLLDQFTQQADIVIIDSPPLLAVTDSSILANKVDATLLVIESNRTHAQACDRALTILKQVGANPPIGLVLNKLKSASLGKGYYYQQYYYSSYHSHKPSPNGKAAR